MISPCRLPLPTDRWVRLLLPAVLIFFAAASDRNYQTDLWHHLTRGRAIVEQGQLIDRDLFTFTVAGQPFQDVNWLTQLGYHGLYETGGLPLVQLVNALSMAVALAWLVPQDSLLALPVVARFFAASALAFAPVFLANLVFAQRFSDVQSSGTAFAVNLLGAMAGGALEYLSLITGYHVLLIVIAVLYALAFVTGLRGRPAPRPA